MEFGDALLVFEVRGLVASKDEGLPVKSRWSTSTTRPRGGSTNGKFYPKNGGAARRRWPTFDVEVTPGGAFGSFIDAVRSRKAEDLNADAETATTPAALCHLANISYRLGEQVSWDQKLPSGERGRQPPDKQVVTETFAALESNLTKGIGLKLDGLTYQLGRTLAFDPKTEKFVKDPQADQLLTREYREPFVVAEKV